MNPVFADMDGAHTGSSGIKAANFGNRCRQLLLAVLISALFVTGVYAGQRPSLEEGWSMDDFQAYAGETFQVFGGEGVRHVELLTLTRLEPRGRNDGPVEQFTLHFEGELKGLLPKGSYWFKHPESGRFRLFIESNQKETNPVHIQVDMLLLKTPP